MKKLHPSRRFAAALIVCIALSGIGLAFAQEIIVQQESIALREKQKQISRIVAKANRGDKLTKVDQQGPWLRMRLGNQEGWVHQDDLVIASKQPGGANLLAALQGSNAQASETTAAAASKGIGADSTKYAAAKGYSTDALRKMIANRDRVTAERVEIFEREGSVGALRK